MKAKIRLSVNLEDRNGEVARKGFAPVGPTRTGRSMIDVGGSALSRIEPWIESPTEQNKAKSPKTGVTKSRTGDAKACSFESKPGYEAYVEEDPPRENLLWNPHQIWNWEGHNERSRPPWCRSIPKNGKGKGSLLANVESVYHFSRRRASPGGRSGRCGTGLPDRASIE